MRRRIFCMAAHRTLGISAALRVDRAGVNRRRLQPGFRLRGWAAVVAGWGGGRRPFAAGLSAAGLGSDSGGSVREPAHFTGICSLKPTPGRIPGRGHLPPCVGPFATLGAIGPMARTIADVSLMFRTLSGQDPLNPLSPPVLLREPSLDELRTVPIGFFEDDGLVPVTPETRAAVQAAAAAPIGRASWRGRG